MVERPLRMRIDTRILHFLLIYLVVFGEFVFAIHCFNLNVQRNFLLPSLLGDILFLSLSHKNRGCTIFSMLGKLSLKIYSSVRSLLVLSYRRLIQKCSGDKHCCSGHFSTKLDVSYVYVFFSKVTVTNL